MARKKKKSLWAGLPYAASILFGAIAVGVIDGVNSPWHVVIPWSLAAIFFIMWRVTARSKTVKIAGEEDKSPRVKRLI